MAPAARTSIVSLLATTDSLRDRIRRDMLVVAAIQAGMHQSLAEARATYRRIGADDHQVPAVRYGRPYAVR
jgi:hypothetical protein